MSTSIVYAYQQGKSGLFVSERGPVNRRGEDIVGKQAQDIHDSADFVCVSHYSREVDEWILHAKDGAEYRVPLLHADDKYQDLAAQCENIAGRGGLTILFS